MKDSGSAEGGGADGLKDSHYDILGVRESADRRSIRAAYLKKIKASHPDRARRGKAADRAAAINQAYFVLRDPRRRLAYDLDLKRLRNGTGSGGPVGLWRPRSLSAAPPPPPRSRKAIASAVLLGAAIVGLVLLILDLESPTRPTERLAAAEIQDSAIPNEIEPSPWVDRAMVDRAVETLMLIRTGGRDAQAYSRNCFLALGERPSALLLDHCLAFDVAAAHWRPPGTELVEADFAPRQMAPRHAAAMRRLAIAEGGRDRIREVNVATFAALARRLRPAEQEEPAEQVERRAAAADYDDAVEEAGLAR